MHIPKTIEELALLWLEAKTPIVKITTLCCYRTTVYKYIIPRFGHLHGVSEDDIQAYVYQGLKEGYAKKTARDVVATLKAIFRYGARRGWSEKPDWEIHYPREESARKLPILSIKHHRQLLAYLTEKPDEKNIGILIALNTGMRIGEICGLEWADVDLVHRTIRVRQTYSEVYNCVTGATHRVLSSPKTKTSNREIPISTPLYNVLRQLKRTATTPYIVIGTAGKPVAPRVYRDYFSRLLARLQVPRIVFHGLRHTFATRCIESGCDPKTVSTILGHCKVALTLDLYVHPNLEQKKKVIDKMNRMVI